MQSARLWLVMLAVAVAGEAWGQNQTIQRRQPDLMRQPATVAPSMRAVRKPAAPPSMAVPQSSPQQPNFRIQLETSRLSNAESPRSQASKRLGGNADKGLTRSWGDSAPPPPPSPDLQIQEQASQLTNEEAVRSQTDKRQEDAGSGLTKSWGESAPPPPPSTPPSTSPSIPPLTPLDGPPAVQQESRNLQTLSNIQKQQHDTAKSMIQNMK